MTPTPKNGRPERFTRVKDWKKYRDNFDRIFRKKQPTKKKSGKSPK